MIIWLKLSISIDFWTQLLLKAHRHFWTQLLIRWLKTGSPKYQWPWSWSVRISEIPRVIASCHELLEFKWSQVCLGFQWWKIHKPWATEPDCASQLTHSKSLAPGYLRSYDLSYYKSYWLQDVCDPVTWVTWLAPCYLWPSDLSHIIGSMLSVAQWPEPHDWLHVICGPVTLVTLLAPCYLWPSDLSHMIGSMLSVAQWP